MGNTKFDDPNRCSKDDEPAIGPCMCPQCMADAIKTDTTYTPKGLVITDEYLISPDPEHRVAWFFTCPSCKMGNIADYNPRCPDCGEILIFRSQTVFSWVRDHATRNRIKK